MSLPQPVTGSNISGIRPIKGKRKMKTNLTLRVQFQVQCNLLAIVVARKEWEMVLAKLV
jgi:hypothetical protein